jgi:hypothetical protein
MKGQLSIDWMFGFLMLLSAIAALAAQNSSSRQFYQTNLLFSSQSASLVSDSFEVQSASFLHGTPPRGAHPFNPRGNCLAYANSSACVMMPFKLYSSEQGVAYENINLREPF